MIARDWNSLTRITAGAAFDIERIRLLDDDVVIEGRFELPALARLSSEDQVFVAAFVRCHGSIKQMEKFFGASYPTIKNRLNRIGALLPMVEVDAPAEAEGPSVGELLTRLERGEMQVNEVLRRLRGEE
jgi:hypothetical protein